MWVLNYLINWFYRLYHLFETRWEQARRLLDAFDFPAWVYIEGRLRPLGEALGIIFGRIRYLFYDLFDRLKTIVQVWFGQLGDFVHNLYAHVVSLARTYYNRLISVVTTWWNELDDLLHSLYVHLSLLARTWYERIVKVVHEWWTIVSDIVLNLYYKTRSLAVELYTALVELARNLYCNLVDLARELYHVLVDLGRNLYASIVFFLRESAGHLQTLVLHLAPALFGAVIFRLPAIKWVLSEGWDKLMSLLTNPKDTIWAFILEEIEERICEWLADNW